MTKTILFILSALLIRCSNSATSTNPFASPSPGNNSIQKVLAKTLDFSQANEPVRMNEHLLAKMAKPTQLVFPFEMSDQTDFRILTKNFKYDCEKSQCSGYLKFKIVDKETDQVVADDVRVSRPYSLLSHRAYLLVVDFSAVSESGENYKLNFAVWRGSGQRANAVTTCTEDAETSFDFSVKGIQRRTSNGQISPYYEKGIACGQTLGCEFSFLQQYDVPTDLSANGLRYTSTNAGEIDDLAAAITYQAQISNFDVSDPDSLNLICFRYKAGRVDTGEVLEKRVLRNCKTITTVAP